MSETLVVSLYGGPGIGKSTTAAELFAKLKNLGYNAEMAHEYAKDLTWEEAHGKLAFQPYTAAKQMWRVERLLGKVDVIVTDTSPLLALVYGQPRTPSFFQWIAEEYARLNTLNILLQRDPHRAYNSAGRTQTQKEAEALDLKIENMLSVAGVNYHPVNLDQYTVGRIGYLIANRLDD